MGLHVNEEIATNLVTVLFKFFKKKGIIKGNIVDDVNRLFEVLNVNSLDEFMANIEHYQY